MNTVTAVQALLYKRIQK